MRKIKVIIQCRTNSSRLPGKAFLPLKGIPAVLLCAQRAMNKGAEVIIATSDNASDDNLALLLQKNNINFIRGSLDDVLQRYVLATQDLTASDLVVRLTADNVFPDGEFIQQLVNYVIEHQLEYCRTDPQINGFPYGLGAEVFTAAKLWQAGKNATSLEDREHVTPWIQRNSPNAIYAANVQFKLAHLRCTLDTLEDYLQLQDIFEKIDDPIAVSWRELCDHLANRAFSKTINTDEKSYAISPLTLGTAQVGLPYGVTNSNGLMSEKEAAALIQCALKNDINTFDCARGYGEAEKRIGKILKDKNVTIITKLDPFFDKNIEPELFKYCVKASIYQSCYELNRKSLDVLMLHRFWQLQQPQIWETLITLKTSKVIKHLGISVATVEEALKAIQNEEIEFIQIPFNVVDKRWLDESFQQQVKEKKKTIFARSVFLQGLLISPISLWPEHLRNIGNSVLPALSRVTTALQRKDVQDLCLNYVRAQPWIQSVVIGCLGENQLLENMACYNEKPLTLEECQYVQANLPVLPEQFLNPALW